MFFGKFALILLAAFGLALVVRLVLGLRKFQRRYDEHAGAAAERFRHHLASPSSLPGGDAKPPSQ
jgi:hypothetical protein